MAALLYRLGRGAFRRRWLVVVLWLAVVGGVAAAAAQAPAAPPDDDTIPGTELQQANDLLDRDFHANADGASAQLVFVAPDGRKVTASAYEKAIGEAVGEAANSSQVAGASDPFADHTVSEDGSTALATVNYTAVSDDLTTATKDALQDAVDRGHAAGLTVEIGGNALHTAPSEGAGVIVSVAIAALVLVLTFGSLVAAGLPLLTAAIGVGLSLAAIMALSSALGLSGSALSLGLMLGLAVGIDYGLFIVSRFREEREAGHDPREAAGRAVGTAGSAVVFAGLTVIIALGGLAVVGIPSVTKMGLAAAATVAVAVLVAVTVTPALLGFWPRAVLPRATRRKKPVAVGRVKPNLGSRWAAFVMRRPLTVLLVSVIGLGVLAVPAASLKLGEAGNAVLPTSDTQRRAYDDISRAFGPGYNGQLTLVVTAGDAPDPARAAAAVAEKIGDLPGVVSVSPPQFDERGNTAVVSAIPAAAPDAQETTDLVNTIRDHRDAIEKETGAGYLVTGLTAANIDIAQKVSGALLPYVLAVVGLAFLLLLVVFRSLLVPLKATVGFVLSLLAGLGMLVAVFQWGWLGSLLGVNATGPIQSMMPIFLAGISFGLAMDYEVFLVSRIRESHARGEDARQAVLSGFGQSARVVVAAALIMIAVFAGFVSGSDAMMKMIGFGLAAAVLLDAFVVRMTIVPAVLALLGSRAWWLPARLDRVLPRVDIEGESLSHSAPAPTPAEAHPLHTIGSPRG
ncbi:MMPL family transporter [Streptomyces longispororuber]|uniref:MMPL family transporter n=1 Tax=Streptomyces longispororuber TaxID=68230 RepID=UPI00210CBEF1|nr:MMPL family transporter [Streptomyces longispororuber]MCQ4205536.1 MMPL family transporter [Streptomyces longispororuber]